MNNSQVNGLLKIADIMKECEIEFCQKRGFLNGQYNALNLDLSDVHSGRDLEEAVKFTYGDRA